MTDWYRLDAAAVADRLQVDVDRGLDSEVARQRLEEHGPNELVETGGRSPWQILFEQLRGPMILLLAAAAIISLALGEAIDSIAILTIVALNAALGFAQDYRAERAMAALRQMAVPTVRVRRDGATCEISARELVPGDVVVLEAGSIVPADAQVIDSASLHAQEAALTGESEPVAKDPAPIDASDLPLGDRRNQVYMGTAITYGHGRAVVVATGMQTELGRIAELLQTVRHEQTPLERHLAQLGRGLAIAALAIVAAIFLLGLAQGRDWKLMLLTGMSLAVAAVPEGLPAVATVTLAIGARRMLRRQALIRKLPAVETLGSVTVICSDKTGTLTENRMTVTTLDLVGRRIELGERGEKALQENSAEGSGAPTSSLDGGPFAALVLAAAAACNDAELQAPAHDERRDDEAAASAPRAIGEPTETALVVAAARAGLAKDELDRRFPRVHEAPFDSNRKRMSTVHRIEQGDAPATFVQLRTALDRLGPSTDARFVTFSKGAIDSLLEVAISVVVDGCPVPLDDEQRRQIGESHDELAARGMRVLGVAVGRSAQQPSGPAEAIERGLTLVGLVAMIDPPRAEAARAVAQCRAAGIRPIMITGDHRLTALQIARELSIVEGDACATGEDLSRATDAEFDALVARVSVFARVSPEHKLRIVDALQRSGQIVAMTGDGVNDAPALKRADIGVAMGITGTDVSKEAADMVLLDDNFATIVRAVEQGRIIYDNIRKFIKYLLASNVGEVFVMAVGPLLGMPIPLLPLQILWVNLVTDGLPGLALAVERAESDTMRRPPYPPGESFFARGMGRDVLWIGVVLGLVTLAAAYYYWDPAHPEDLRWQTIAFTVLTFSQMGNVLALRSSRDSFFAIGPFSNRPLIAAVALTVALHTAVVYLPAMQKVFRTTPLGWTEVIFCGVVSVVVFVLVEISKWFVRRSSR